MATNSDVGAGIDQPLERRDRRANAKIVGDLAVAKRNVEVGPYEDPTATEIAEVLELRYRHGSLILLCEFLAGNHGQIDKPVGVAHLVVVPAHDLDQVADNHREACIEGAGRARPTMSELTRGSSL